MFCICRCSVLSSVIFLLFLTAPFSTTSAPFRSTEITVLECKGVDSRFIIRTKIFFLLRIIMRNVAREPENKKGARTTKNSRTFCEGGLQGGAFAGDGTISEIIKNCFSRIFHKSSESTQKFRPSQNLPNVTPLSNPPPPLK